MSARRRAVYRLRQDPAVFQQLAFYGYIPLNDRTIGVVLEVFYLGCVRDWLQVGSAGVGGELVTHPIRTGVSKTTSGAIHQIVPTKPLAPGCRVTAHNLKSEE